MPSPSKTTEKLIRQYASIVHDRELGRTLEELRTEFDRWETGKISAVQLSDHVHKYHQGTLKEIWAKHEMSSKEVIVAQAIASGILHEEDIPDEIREHLGRKIEFFREELSE